MVICKIRRRRGRVVRVDGIRPGVVIVGGVLSDAMSYLGLAVHLAESFEVHLVNRRSRPGSEPMRPEHRIEDERADVAAGPAGRRQTAP